MNKHGQSIVLLVLSAILVSGCSGILKPGDMDYAGAWKIESSNIEVLGDDTHLPYVEKKSATSLLTREIFDRTTDDKLGVLSTIHFVRTGRSLADDATVLTDKLIKEQIEAQLGVSVEIDNFENTKPGDGQTLSFVAGWKRGEKVHRVEVFENSRYIPPDEDAGTKESILTILRHTYQTDGLTDDIDHAMITAYRPDPPGEG